MSGSVLESERVRGQVLLFRTPPADPRSEKIMVNVFLLPGEIPLEQVKLHQFLMTEHIDAPRECELVPDRFYTVDCPSAELIHPERAQFYRVHEASPIGTFLLTLSPQSSPMSIRVREVDSSEEVWSVSLDPSDTMWTRDERRTIFHGDARRLLGENRCTFVEKVSDPELNQLLDRLLQERVMTQEEFDTARAKPRADKARYVLDTVMRKGSLASSLLIQYYQQLNHYSEFFQQLSAVGDQRSETYVRPDSEQLGEGTSAVQHERKLNDPAVGPGRGFKTRKTSPGPGPQSQTQNPPHHGEEIYDPSHHKATASPRESLFNSKTTKTKHSWLQISERWREKLTELHNSLEKRPFIHKGSLKFVKDERFLIGKGSEGTEVFLGLRNDGTEVAIKRMIKSNYDMLKNEEEFLRLPKLDRPNIVRYIDFAEDSDFGYLALQLCEYTLEERIEQLKTEPTDVQREVQKSLVQQILMGLKELHGQNPRILHRDLKPQNVLIDINGQVRLADFGLSRKLPDDRSTVYTRGFGTKCWIAREILINRNEELIPHKRSTDVQVAGMLVYYILSGGKHPFDKGDVLKIESNIKKGKYRLDLVEDVVAKDLIEEMINKDPEQRPSVDECLRHPFLWEESSRREYLKDVWNLEVIGQCRTAPEELVSAVEGFDVQESLKNWKDKFPRALVQSKDSYGKPYPENPLGLLRFLRNLHEHWSEDKKKLSSVEEAEQFFSRPKEHIITELFPDLFGIIYTFEKKRGWNQEPAQGEMFPREGEA